MPSSSTGAFSAFIRPLATRAAMAGLLLCACGDEDSPTQTDVGDTTDVDADTAGSDAADVTDAADATTDTAPEDAADDVEQDVIDPLCGNGTFDPGERCDDGNNAAGDGCSPACLRESFCGDGVLDDGELCDDGNNSSGDGCRSDCQSEETCGNGIVDYAMAEVCDGSEGCESCLAVTGCGDGEITGDETCDDGNTAPFDGCDAACQAEHPLVVNTLALASKTSGCDLNGDGVPDNGFARALGPLAAAINPLIRDELSRSEHRIVWIPQGLDDPTATNDLDFRLAWVTSEDADDDPDNDFDGRGVFTINPSVIDDDGVPYVGLQSTLVDNALSAGPEDILLLDEDNLRLELRAGKIVGTTLAEDGALYGMEDGFICGGFDMPLLIEASALAQERVITLPPCDGGEPAQLVDVMIGGGDVEADLGNGATLPLTFDATTPDLDLDGDGLEGFEFATGEDCQPVIAACIDGDGTRIEGRDCLYDPAISDGYSASFAFTAIDATVLGVR